MKNIPITLYLAINATEDAQALAAKYNLHPVTIQETFQSLNAILRQFPEEAYNDFGLIHPDRIMIMDATQQQEAPPVTAPVTIPAVIATPVTTPVKESVSNADGATVPFKCGDRKSGADGTTEDATNSGFSFDLKKNLPFIGVTAVFLTGLIILAKNL